MKCRCRLPKDRHDLYSRLVENVLFQRYNDPKLVDKYRERLGVIAHEMHTGKITDPQRHSPHAEVSWREVEAALESFQTQSRYIESGFVTVTNTREQLLSHSGLLLPRNDKKAAFYHLSIQEHLAAVRILDIEPQKNILETFQRRSAVLEWRFTLSFLFGAFLSRNKNGAVELVEDLVANVSSEDVRLQVVIADVVMLMAHSGIYLRAPHSQSFIDIVLTSIAQEVEVPRDVNIRGGRIGERGFATAVK